MTQALKTHTVPTSEIKIDTPAVAAVISVTPQQMTSLNTGYADISRECDLMVIQLSGISKIESLAEFNDVQLKCKNVNRDLQKLVEKRMVLTRVVKTVSDQLMVPEKKVAAEINRVMGELTAFQKRKAAEEKEAKEKQLKEAAKRERIVNGYRDAKLSLETILIEVRVALVDRFPMFLRDNVKSKSFTVLSSAEQVGKLQNRYVMVRNAALTTVTADEEKKEVVSLLDQDDHYSYPGFLARVNADLLSLLTSASIGALAQQKFYDWAKTQDAMEIDNFLDGIKENLANLVPEYKKVKEIAKQAPPMEKVAQGTAPVQVHAVTKPVEAPSVEKSTPQIPVALVNPKVVAQINSEASITLVKAAISDKKVTENNQANGVGEKTITIIENSEGMIGLINYYLKGEGQPGLEKIIKNLEFVLTYASKTQPEIKGVRYNKESVVTLR